MTKQETFDFVCTALIKQGKPAHDHGVCSYRAPDGCKCAAGHLIPDDKYDPKFEGSNVARTDIANIILAEGHNFSLVAALQRCHDMSGYGKNVDDPKYLGHKQWLADFKQNAREVAERHELSPAVLD